MTKPSPSEELLAKRRKDAERKRRFRRRKHLQKQVGANPINHSNKKDNKIKVWCGSISGNWKTATQMSKFCDVSEIGLRKRRGAVVFGAIVKFDGEDELEIVEKSKCMESIQCLARQGDHDSAEYYNAERRLRLGDYIRVKWPSRLDEQWLPIDQVQDLPAGRQRTRSKFRYKPGDTLTRKTDGDLPSSLLRVPKTSPRRKEMDMKEAAELNLIYSSLVGIASVAVRAEDNAANLPRPDYGSGEPMEVGGENNTSNPPWSNKSEFIEMVTTVCKKNDERNSCKKKERKKKKKSCKKRKFKKKKSCKKRKFKKCSKCVIRAVKGGLCARCYNYYNSNVT
jgi:hypothetical protein